MLISLPQLNLEKINLQKKFNILTHKRIQQVNTSKQNSIAIHSILCKDLRNLKMKVDGTVSGIKIIASTIHAEALYSISHFMLNIRAKDFFPTVFATPPQKKSKTCLF